MDDFADNLQRMLVKDEDENAALEAVKLLSSVDKDLPLRTELTEPMTFTIMSGLADYLKTRKMRRSAKLLKSIQQYFITYMVSKDRKGRQEIIEVLKQNKEESEDDKLNKLLSRGD